MQEPLAKDVLSKDNQVVKDIFSFLKQIELDGFTSENWYYDCLPLSLSFGLYVVRDERPILVKTDITGKQQIQTSITICYQGEKGSCIVDPLLQIEFILLQEQENSYSNISLTNGRVIAIDKVKKQNITQHSSTLESMSITYQILYQTKEEF